MGNKLDEALSIFGQDFEANGGYRSLLMAPSFHPQSPVDDVNLYTDLLGDYVSEDDFLAGGSEKDLENLWGACFDLREAYGHGRWLRRALVAYFQRIKGLSRPNAEKLSEVVYAEGVAKAGEKMLHQLLAA